MNAISINPTNGEKIFETPYISKKDLINKIEIAKKGYQIWKNKSFEERGEMLQKLIQIMSENKEELAHLNTLEMGMLYKDALGDVSKSISNISYFAIEGKNLLADEEIEKYGIKAKIVYEPLGIIYCVTPWNYPYNQVFRSTIPNLIAGNVVIVKHASNVSQVSLKIQEMFIEAGFPEGVFTSLIIPSSFSEDIIKNEAIVGVSVTGGDKAGRNIGTLAGKYLKPSVLELGGNDSFIAINYKDIDKLTDFAINARLSNCGQKCNSSKRFIILEDIYEEFIQKLTSKVKSLKIGDPFDSETQIGPVAKEDVLNEIHEMVTQSINAGAKLATGGKKIEGNGFFYEPTIIYDVKKGMRVFDEEVFGPVISIIKAKNKEEIISIANDSMYGLGASIFGDDINEVEELARKIEVGNIGINKLVTSYSFLPYGGIKNSGYGKELGERGIKTFCNQKVIVY